MKSSTIKLVYSLLALSILAGGSAVHAAPQAITFNNFWADWQSSKNYRLGDVVSYPRENGGPWISWISTGNRNINHVPCLQSTPGCTTFVNWLPFNQGATGPAGATAKRDYLLDGYGNVLGKYLGKNQDGYEVYRDEVQNMDIAVEVPIGANTIPSTGALIPAEGVLNRARYLNAVCTGLVYLQADASKEELSEKFFEWCCLLPIKRESSIYSLGRTSTNCT
jgi:hypothetical protein